MARDERRSGEKVPRKSARVRARDHALYRQGCTTRGWGWRRAWLESTTARLPRSEAMCQYHRPLSLSPLALFSPFPIVRARHSRMERPSAGRPRSLAHSPWMAEGRANERANHFPRPPLPTVQPPNHSWRRRAAAQWPAGGRANRPLPILPPLTDCTARALTPLSRPSRQQD